MEGTITTNVGNIEINCISEQASDLLDRIMSQWEEYYSDFKQVNPRYEASFYGFAYWLVRYSGLIQPSINWIDVKDRLPDDDERVLTISPCYDQPENRYRLLDGKFVRICKDVTRWISVKELEEKL